MLEGTEKRPGDVTLPGYPVGMDTILDVTVVNPVQTKYRGVSGHQGGSHGGGKAGQKANIWGAAGG